MAASTKVIRLKQKPAAAPTADTFAFDTHDLPSTLEPGYVVLKALWISVDPYIRGTLWKIKTNSVITSPQIAQVIRSNDATLKTGDIISGMGLPWSTCSVFKANPKAYRLIMRGHEVRSGVDVSAHLGPLGLIGITAYQGLFDIGNLRKGENVFVSGAAGAVGSIVGQIAKHVMGCTVVGTAGSDAKCEWLKELGFDAAMNYKDFNGDSKAFQKALGAAFGGRGVDVYFDNTGGFQTESIWDLLNYKGRVVVCGQIANYNKMLAVPKIDDFLYKTIYQHIRIEGFSIHSFKRYKEFYSDMQRWMDEGKVRYRKTVKYGLEQVPAAFMGLFSGENIGKMLVKMSDPQIPSKL